MSTAMTWRRRPSRGRNCGCSLGRGS
ncbi:hypothetical protein Ahy_Scaffold1g106960 isoform F [Arachis hypogaea]|uniref:Uncharacterized protein n=1 Tax=Arachis hypogaea TaxID=3818 RepID=A0A444WTP7_ARAHY|nr:hypothetical protein Ahy_Scaffold1g106960 isoform F [Arachis hypogaea]